MAPLKILSIDGGGTRGIIPATILDCIFKETGKHPLEYFDLLAGTSTGGILSTAYAYGLPTDELVKLYLKKSGDIFYDSGWDDFRDGFGKNFGADYSNKRLKKILTSIFGKTTLGSLHQQMPKGKSLMVCSFDLNPEKEGRPVNFRPKVFHSDFIKDAGTSLVDLCLMTSAGPTYFPVYKDHVDGGVSLNNPSMAAVAYAINKSDQGGTEYRHPDGALKGLGYSLGDLKLYSLGCGTSNKNFIPSEEISRRKGGDWGNLQWIKYLPDMLTETNVQASIYYVTQLLNEDQYRRDQLYFDRPEAPEPIRNKVMSLDVKDPKLLKSMHNYAKEYFKAHRQEIIEFVK